MKIVISKDFTDNPGARYYSDGKYSGQEFLLEYLIPAFEEAVKKNEELIIDLDDTWGYASSFISASFGCLSKIFGKEEVLERLELISEDEPNLKSKIINEINNPEINRDDDCRKKK